MGFGLPLMLLGLAGVAIPVLIHLLNRRRFDVVDWGAMQFLQICQTTRRRLLLEELLESGLFIVAAFEDESEMRRGLSVGNGAAIELGAGETMHVALERDAIGIVNGLRDTRSDARRLRNLRGGAVGLRLRLRGSAQRRKRQ